MIRSFTVYLFLVVLLCLTEKTLVAQTVLSIKSGEKWYGGAVNEAHLMPFKDGYSLNMYGDTKGNQAAPLLLSTKGRFVWSEESFKFAFDKNKLIISNSNGAVVVDSAGKNLRDAFTNASKRFFPSKNKLPDTLFYRRPQ
jgi:hypothetical protein